MQNLWYTSLKGCETMIFGKHINRYYLRFLPVLLLGVLALIFVDYFQLKIPEYYRMVINGINEGYVIRNGKLYREKKLSSSREDLVIDENGLMYWIREGKVSAEDLWNGGAEQVLSFGPVLLDDSRVQVTSADEIGKWDSNPRTAIGMIEPLHYLFVVSDGRTDRSAGLSLVQLAEFMESWGCTFAYNLDGGGSATMVFQGRLINKPTTDGKSFGERKVSDVVYIGY